MRKKPETADEVMRRWPRITAHIICHSLGYATPSKAAWILLDAYLGRENWCEWVDACYKRDPRPAVKHAIMNRHTHEGYMADYGLAYSLVRRAIDTGEEPIFASWF